MKQTTKPKELDLNITQMRIDAMSDLLATLHEKMKRFDDIDVLERVLNQHTPQIARRAAVEARSNGSNGYHAEPEETDPPKPKMKRRPSPVRLKHVEVSAAVQSALEAHPEGLRVVQLIALLRQSGLIPPLLNDDQATVAIRKPIARGLSAKRIGKVQPNLKQPATYFATGVPVPAPMPAVEPLVKIPQELSVGDAVVQCMLTWPPNAQIRPVEISERLIASGWPKMRGGNPLNNHVNWAFASLVNRNVVARKDRGKFPAYVLKRPVISVTKE